MTTQGKKQNFLSWYNTVVMIGVTCTSLGLFAAFPGISGKKALVLLFWHIWFSVHSQISSCKLFFSGEEEALTQTQGPFGTINANK